MKIKRCSPAEIDAVMRVFNDESVYCWISDDGSANGDALKQQILQLLHNVNVYFLMPRADTVIMLAPQNAIMFEVHVSVIDSDARKHAANDAYNCLLWMIEHTPAKKFTTQVPGNNRVAAFFARRCGMKKEGTLKRAFLKDEKLWDIELYGATDKEVLKKRRK